MHGRLGHGEARAFPAERRGWCGSGGATGLLQDREPLWGHRRWNGPTLVPPQGLIEATEPGGISAGGRPGRRPLLLVAVLWRTTPRQVACPRCPVRSSSTAPSPAAPHLPHLPHLGDFCQFPAAALPQPSPSEGPDGPKLPRELERGGRLRRWAAAPARPRPPPAGIPARAAEWLRGRRPGEEGGWAGLSAARGLGAAAQ